MSASVDVLAVIRRACDADALPYEVHAAVAELIVQRDALAACLRRAVEAGEARMPAASFLYDARAALARVGGAA